MLCLFNPHQYLRGPITIVIILCDHYFRIPVSSLLMDYKFLALLDLKICENFMLANFLFINILKTN